MYMYALHVATKVYSHTYIHIYIYIHTYIHTYMTIPGLSELLRGPHSVELWNSAELGIPWDLEILEDPGRPQVLGAPPGLGEFPRSWGNLEISGNPTMSRTPQVLGDCPCPTAAATCGKALEIVRSHMSLFVLCIYMCASMYRYIYMYIYIDIHIYIHVYIYIYVCIHVYINSI